jgi:demethylmenaquinone methyltransferase/2-methoxy-6-polyprenyl-1,4-benzoquinol methylase
MEPPAHDPAGSKASTRAFDLLSGVYELGSWVYSAGSIQSSKAVQSQWLKAGAKVLYLGVGAGEDALCAAKAGCRTTCLDLSPQMLGRLASKLRRANAEAELICGDALDHVRPEHYDVVAANYFLNMFTEAPLRRMLRHAAELVRPGGRLLIADVAPPPPGRAAAALYRLYLDPGKIAAWAAGLLAWHPNYDYLEMLAGTGLELEQRQEFRPLGVGPTAFRHLALVKRNPSNSAED